MILTDDLLKTAALGTEQRPGHLPQIDTPFNDFMAQMAGMTTEAQLLLTAAGIQLQRQAGYQPDTHPSDRLPPAPREPGMPCSPRAVRHLLLMLEGVHQNLLPVWLHEIQTTSQRAPAEVLPLLLSYGSKQAEMREALLPVLGARGRWLAEQGGAADWRWVLESELEKGRYANDADAWLDYFKRLRERDPDRARDLLADYWPRIESRLKKALLAAMKIGLSRRDEAYLEERLEDGWTAKRAARMLAALPESDFGRQARRAAERMLLITRMGHQQKWVIDFVWSRAFRSHPAWRERSYASRLLRPFRQHWTPEQLLSFLPLSYWYRHWDVTPHILVEGARNSTNPEAILEAWTQVAIWENDNDFALELLRRVNPNRISREGRLMLIEMLTPQQIERVAVHWLDSIRQGIRERHPAIPLLETHRQRWSDELMLSFLASLERGFTVTARPLLVRSVRSLLVSVVPYFSLEMIDEVKRVLRLNQRPELSESELEVIDGIVAVLDFQQDMIRAIRNRER